jgi:hypothetical protein
VSLLAAAAGPLFFLPGSNAFCPPAFVSGSLFWKDTPVELLFNFPLAPVLTNGTASYRENAEAAAEDWNRVSDGFRFVSRGNTVTGQSGNPPDMLNVLSFDDNIGGMSFGGDVVALTLLRFNASTGELVDTDIVFRDDEFWDAYDGPVQFGFSGGPINDFRRVCLHELGHALGLDHPDAECGQDVDAIMNSRSGDLDRLSQDDMAGLISIYGGGNRPPVADPGPDQSGDGSRAFVLNGSRSTDPDGSIELFEWIENGMVFATGLQTVATFDFGEHIITLRVTDSDGLTDQASLVISVTGFKNSPTDGSDNTAPTADAGDNITTSAGALVTLDGSGSFDAEGAIGRYLWSENGNIIATGRIATVSFSPGTHIVTLTVFDEDEASDADTVVVTVTNGAINGGGGGNNGSGSSGSSGASGGGQIVCGFGVVCLPIWMLGWGLLRFTGVCRPAMRRGWAAVNRR